MSLLWSHGCFSTLQLPGYHGYINAYRTHLLAAFVELVKIDNQPEDKLVEAGASLPEYCLSS